MNQQDVLVSAGCLCSLVLLAGISKSVLQASDVMSLKYLGYMNNDLNHAHIYPMKKLGQSINQIMGFLAWLDVFAGIFASLFLVLIFPWNRKIIPAFRKMMTGIPGSYLRISDSGLEYRLWPFTEIRCQWEDVKCIKKRRWFGDVLYLHRAEEIGFAEFSINLSPPQIHLTSLVGWQEGELKDDLRHYAPQLFQES